MLRKVVKTRLLEKCKGSPANVNCRVDTLGRVVGGFDMLKRKWITKMGFDGIFRMNNKRLSRSLCYFIMTLFDPFNQVLMLPGGVYEPSTLDIGDPTINTFQFYVLIKFQSKPHLFHYNHQMPFNIKHNLMKSNCKVSTLTACIPQISSITFVIILFPLFFL